MTAAARRSIAAAAPRVPQAHLVAAGQGGHLFLADGSQLFDVDAALYAELDAAMAAGRLDALLGDAGLAGRPAIDDEALAPPPVHALSLAVAQKCNLGCGYCYAQQGGFGAPATNMALSTALAAVDLLVGEAEPGVRLNLAFLGGEPLVNRPVLQAATRHAAEAARRRGVRLGFSITTNGTLVTEADADFFEEHGFAVTVSLDGTRAAHDALRPYRGGRGSYDAIMARIAPLLARQRQMQVTARVTVTPRNLALRETLDTFLDAGFYSVGFAPMLASPTGTGAKPTL